MCKGRSWSHGSFFSALSRGIKLHQLCLPRRSRTPVPTPAAATKERARKWVIRDFSYFLLYFFRPRALLAAGSLSLSARRYFPSRCLPRALSFLIHYIPAQPLVNRRITRNNVTAAILLKRPLNFVSDALFITQTYRRIIDLNSQEPVV